MTEDVRLDPIGQEILVNEVVLFKGTPYLVTKLNPSMIRLNGKTDTTRFDVVVITNNLIALGKQNVIDNLRTRYAACIDHTPPQERKVPIRYVVVGKPGTKSNPQWLVRIEASSISNARIALMETLKDAGIDRTHVLYIGPKKTEWTSYYYVQKQSVLAAAKVPACMASLISLADPIIEIPDGFKFEGGI